jgi:hypothetical protein
MNDQRSCANGAGGLKCSLNCLFKKRFAKAPPLVSRIYGQATKHKDGDRIWHVAASPMLERHRG